MIGKPLLLAIATFLVLPLAAAQTLDEPIRERAAQKTSAAMQDPQTFVAEHASEAAVAAEAEWTIAYACFAIEYAHDEAGTPDPELKQCERYEEVLGIEPDPEEPVAEVENVSEEAVAQVEEITDDVHASIDEVVETPEEAPAILVELALGTIERILDTVDWVGDTAAATAANVVDLVGRALQADAKMGAAVYGAVEDVTSSTGHAWNVVLGRAAESIAAASDALQAAAQSVAQAAAAAVDAFARFVQGLVPSGDGERVRPSGTGLPDVEGAADPVLGLLEESKRQVARAV